MPRKWKPGEQRRMRRAWARPLSIRSGIQPNREIIQQYRKTAQGLGEKIATDRFPNVSPGRVDIQDRIEEILRVFDDPLFITVIDNSLQRCRLYFNSKHDCYLLQHVNWRTREVRISITYSSRDRAMQVWVQSRVCWKFKKSLPTA